MKLLSKFKNFILYRFFHLEKTVEITRHIGGLAIEEKYLYRKPKPKPKKFKIGERVIYDHINGTDGRCVGEGIVDKINKTQTYGDYLILMNNRRLGWFRESELSKLNEPSWKAAPK